MAALGYTFKAINFTRALIFFTSRWGLAPIFACLQHIRHRRFSPVVGFGIDREGHGTRHRTATRIFGNGKRAVE